MGVTSGKRGLEAKEKVVEYQDQAKKFKSHKLWGKKVKLQPVVGASETIPEALQKHLDSVMSSVKVKLIQKVALQENPGDLRLRDVV